MRVRFAAAAVHPLEDPLKRRTLIAGLCLLPAALVLPASARAAASARIGWLSSDGPSGNSGFDQFRVGMRELGYVEGRNVVIDARWGNGSASALDSIAALLVRSAPDVIVTQGPAIRHIRQTGTALPVVFGFSGDPVAAGYVASFGRPGGNMTGISFLSLDLVGKRIELLQEVVPGLKRVAILANPEHAGEPAELRVSRTAAESVGLKVDYFQVRSAAELETALAGVATARCGAMVLFPDAGMMRYAERVAAFSREQQIPAISGWAVFARRGNLLSYGPNLEDGYGRLATYVDKILRGAKPADLPVELPTKIELVLNEAAARDLGITFSNTLRLRADVFVR